MEKRITKRDVLNYIIKTYANDTMVVEYATHEIELLDRKKATDTKTKTQVENENIKDVIVRVLGNAENAMTITDIQANDETLATLSNQKMSALLKQLVDDNVVVKEVVKKKAYFTLAQ